MKGGKKGAVTQTASQSNPVQLSGDLLQVGNKAPESAPTGGDLGEITNETFVGKKAIYNTFPLVDTGVCVASVCHFNEDATELDNTVVVNVSHDLLFVLGHFCAAEGLDNAEVASDFRHGFGEAFDVVQRDGSLAGPLVRAVVIADEEGEVIYNQLVDEITTEPDYDSTLAALK